MLSYLLLTLPTLLLTCLAERRKKDWRRALRLSGRIQLALAILGAAGIALLAPNSLLAVRQDAGHLVVYPGTVFFLSLFGLFLSFLGDFTWGVIARFKSPAPYEQMGSSR